ncbi:hypothetical protein M8J76_010957 [Diaphorina citri]|nr:hypothetical protein M8J76_010957 [Diaphorina citri]
MARSAEVQRFETRKSGFKGWLNQDEVGKGPEVPRGPPKTYNIAPLPTPLGQIRPEISQCNSCNTAPCFITGTDRYHRSIARGM